MHSIWRNDHALGQDCARHAHVFLGSTDLGLDTAVAGALTLSPHRPGDALRKDYGAMIGMVFGPVPSLDDVQATVRDMEEGANVVQRRPVAATHSAKGGKDGGRKRKRAARARFF